VQGLVLVNRAYVKSFTLQGVAKTYIVSAENVVTVAPKSVVRLYIKLDLEVAVKSLKMSVGRLMPLVLKQQLFHMLSKSSD
jgi:hypothetical protein